MQNCTVLHFLHKLAYRESPVGTAAAAAAEGQWSIAERVRELLCGHPSIPG